MLFLYQDLVACCSTFFPWRYSACPITRLAAAILLFSFSLYLAPKLPAQTFPHAVEKLRRLVLPSAVSKGPGGQAAIEFHTEIKTFPWLHCSRKNEPNTVNLRLLFLQRSFAMRSLDIFRHYCIVA